MIWLKRWLLNRIGITHASLVLPLSGGDEVACMTQHRQYLVIATKYGEVYYIDGDKLVAFSEAEILPGTWADRRWL